MPTDTTAIFEALEPRLLLAANWTVMVYMDGDNNLEAAAIADLNEMETVGSSAAVNVVVQVDRIGGHDATNGNWTDTRRGFVAHDSNTSAVSTPLASIGEVNMGDPAALTGFVQWAAAAYPAGHYALVLWDHGGGTSGVCWDDTSGDHLSVADVGQALTAAGVHIDLLGFDACLMGMVETAYQVRGSADVVVASEQTEPWDGWPYHTVLADLVADPDQTAGALATRIVSRYGEFYHSGGTQSAVSTAGVQTLAANLDALAGAMMAQDADWGAFSSARAAAGYFTDPNYRDLGAVLDGLAARAANATVHAAADAARSAYAAAVIANHSDPAEGGTGLSVYLPPQGGRVASDYSAAQLAFAADTRWDELLAAFVASSTGGTDPNGAIPLATAIRSVPSTISGTVGADGTQDVGGRDVDFFAVSVALGHTLGFDVDAGETGSPLDSVLRLFDSSGRQLAFNDDAYDPDSNVYSYDSYIQYTFSKSETVYVAISGYDNSSYDPAVPGSGTSGATGAYRLRIRDLAASLDANGTIATATTLGAAPVSYFAVLGDERVGNKDVDFYSITVESGQELTISANAAGSGLDAYLRLFSSSGLLLTANDDTNGLDPEIVYDFSTLGAGTYYIGVSGAPNSNYSPFRAASGRAGSTGSYYLTVAGASVHLDFDGTIPLATPVGLLPAELARTIGDEPVGALDVDVYSLVVDDGETVGFDIDTAGGADDLDSVLRLFDATGAELAVSDNAADPETGIQGSDPYVRYTFDDAGTYYVAVSGAPNRAYSPFLSASGVHGSTGAYLLRLSYLGNGNDLNGTIATATPLSVPSVTSAEIGDEPARDRDVDFYSVNVFAGQTIDFDIDAAEDFSNLDSILRLFDADGRQLAINDDGRDPDNFQWTYDPYLAYQFGASGTYYIAVSGYSNDAYDPLTALSGGSGETGPYDLVVRVVRDNSVNLTGSIDSSKLPAFVLPGSKTAGRISRVPVTITNTGKGRARGTISLSLYASDDEVLDPDVDQPLTTLRASINLKPGQSKKYTFGRVLAPELPPGDYYLLVNIDALDAIDETDESDNVAVSTATVAWDSSLLQKGVSLPLWQRDLNSSNLSRTLSELKAAGVTWVGLNVFWFQDDIDSTVIAPDFLRYSASDASVCKAIDAIHHAGLKVMLKPVVDLGNDPGHWRGQIPGSDEWFTGPQGYGTFLRHWAGVAQKKHADLFCIGTELVAASSQEASWRSVIADVRSVYSGPLVYAANHGGAASATEETIEWWDALDYIGLDAYYPLTDKNDPTLDELRTAWTARATTIENWLASLDPADRKPVIFTEVGYRSWDGANSWPSDCSGKGDTNVDQAEQADCYSALLDELWKRKSWLRGIYWWNWEVDPHPAWEAPNWYTPQDKPAEDVIGSYYRPGG